MTGRWSAPRRKRFVLVVAGEVLSQVGDSVYLVALTWLILTKSSPQILAVSLVCLVVPRGVLLLIGGALTDRFSARRVMLCSHLARAGLVAALVASAATGTVQPWEFFAISAAFGVADAFFLPASKTIIATLVPADELVQANAVTTFGEQVAGLIGPAFGGLLVAFYGPVPALAVNAVTFLIAAATIVAAPRATWQPEQGTLTVRGTLAQITEGIAYARAKPGVRVVLVIVSASTLSYSGLFGVALPGLARTLPHSALALGLMLSAWGLGQLLGAASASFTGLPNRWGVFIIAMAYAEAATFVVLGFLPSVWVVVPLFVLLGFGVAYSSDVALPAWIQTTTPEAMLGRVSSVIEMPRTIFEPISIIVMGVLVSIDVRLALICAAVPMLVAAVALSASRSARSMGGAISTGQVGSPVVAQPPAVPDPVAPEQAKCRQPIT